MASSKASSSLPTNNHRAPSAIHQEPTVGCSVPMTLQDLCERALFYESRQTHQTEDAKASHAIREQLQRRQQRQEQNEEKDGTYYDYNNYESLPNRVIDSIDQALVDRLANGRSDGAFAPQD